MYNFYMIDSLYINELNKINQIMSSEAILQAIRNEDFKPKSIVQVDGDRALVQVSGIMVYSPSSFEQKFFNVASTSQLIDTVNQLAKDDKIKSVVFAVDSPGGQAFKINQLADAVLNLSKVKETASVNMGIMASAAYYAFSQVGKVYTDDTLNRTGSIGTKLMVYDQSQMFENMGIKPIKIDTGEYKSMLEDGLPVSDGEISVLQDYVNELQENFNSAVSRVRPMADMSNGSEARNGLAFSAKKAKQLGLIDGVKSLYATFAELSRNAKISNIKKSV